MDKTKVAIVIVCYNNLAYTKITLDSVFKHTTVPYKIFIVNNASKDGTQKYLEDLLEEKSSYFLQVIHSDKNLGFAGGNNLALKVIQNNNEFSHVLLLNNDVIVTEDYIEKMLGAFEFNKNIGLVGPVSNYVGGVQLAAGLHATPENVDSVAEKIFAQNRGQYFEAGLLVGFCLLMKREVLDKIGLLDEIFGLGMWEDNDYDLRARLAGYLLYCIKDTFIYHFGSKTLNSAVNGREQFLKNKKIFYDKWAKIRKNDEHKKIVGMLRVKNGGDLLGKTLTKVSEMVDEVVVFDDHSTDHTDQICKRFPKVVDYFKSDFTTFDEARDRNYVLQMAKKRNPDWIYCIDHDEIPEEKMIKDIQKIVNDVNPEINLFVFKIAHLWNHERYFRTDGLWGGFWQGRLFRNLPNQEIRGDEDGLHCGSHPHVPQMNMKIIPYKIAHYGNIDPSGRFKKYLWYTKTDKKKDVNAILGGHKEYYRELYKLLEKIDQDRRNKDEGSKIVEKSS